ncbi:MAG: SIS domain-containing protein [Phycisphaeraceae bacterium]
MPDPQHPSPNTQHPLAFAQSVLDAEANAIGRIELDASFEKAVELIATLKGSLVVSGLGKSGLIGAKLSATFASTGTPSHVLHPVEALHGDIGKVRQGDAVLMLSNGGGTEEVLTLAALLNQDNISTLAIVGRPGSELGRLATVTLAIGDITEACPHNLAPSASTTAMLALGDALALTVMQQRNFTADDFHKAHPSGGLGKQLMPVTQAMRFKCVGTDANMPLIALGTTMQDAYKTAEQSASDSGLRRAGALLVVDAAGKLAGIVTDGDLRSALINQGPDVWTGSIDSVMTRNPTTLASESMVRDAVKIVREKRFDEIPVIDDVGRPIGIIDVQDLASLKVIEG